MCEYKQTLLDRPFRELESLKRDRELVQQNGLNLRYIVDQTDELCLMAVRKDGLALQYVRNQTTAICETAVNQNIDAVMYISWDIAWDFVEYIVAKLKKETEIAPRENECVSCLVAKKNIACVPCGHLCWCAGCATLSQQQLCPICRADVKSVLTIYQ